MGLRARGKGPREARGQSARPGRQLRPQGRTGVETEKKTPGRLEHRLCAAGRAARPRGGAGSGR